MGHRFEGSVGQRLPVDGLYGPLDIALGGDGWMYVLNKWVEQIYTGRSRYVVVSPEDTYKPDINHMPNGVREVIGKEFLPSPVGCTTDGNGLLFSTDETRNVVVTCTTDGETVGCWGEPGDNAGELNAPSGICIDSEKSLWVVSTRSSRVQRFSTHGKFLGGFGEFGTGPGQLNYPWGVAEDPVNMSLLVADWRNNRVQRFSHDGELLQIIGPKITRAGVLDHPSDVAVDYHGDIYVCDRGNHRVLQFNPSGLFIESFIGDAVMTERGADKLMANRDMLRWRDNIVDFDREKRFYNPTSVTVDDKFRLYVVDTGRFRIQIYRKTFRVLASDEIDPAETYKDPHVN